MPAETVEFSAKVPAELQRRFKDLMPYGGVDWFINSALREFLALVEGNEGTLTEVREAVALSVGMKRQLGAIERMRASVAVAEEPS